MAGSDSRDLTRAEQSYVAQVKYQLRHEPETRQHAMLLAVRRALLSATPVDTYARLEREMGTPADYAARLQGRGDGAARDEVSRPAAARSGSGTGTGRWMILVVVAAIIVVAAIAAIVVAIR